MIVRYNISRNDKGRIFCMSYANTSTYIYNNTVYIPTHLSPTIIDDRQTTTKTYHFYNNIIYNLSSNASYRWKSGATRVFDSNVFYGQHPSGIQSQPESASVEEGTTVSLSVTAAGSPPLSYQWRKSGSDLGNETNAALVWESVGTEHAGEYDVVVVNGFGSVTSAVALLTVTPRGWTPIVTNLAVTQEGFIRGGAYADADQDEIAEGCLRVKHNASPFDFSRKCYVQFDLSGLNVNPNTPAVFSVTTHTNAFAYRAQLWGLNEAYPGFSPALTWNEAQANDTASNDLLTSGSETATRIGPPLLIPNTPSTTYEFSIARMGEFIQDDHVMLVLTGVDDAGNDAGGLRLALNSATLALTALHLRPVFSRITVNADRSVTLECSAEAGLSYRLQAVDPALGSNWTDLSTNRADENGVWRFTDFFATNLSARLYRAVWP